MPKPAPWPGASNSADLSKLLEAEQHRILDLARAQHDAFEQSVQLSLLVLLCAANFSVGFCGPLNSLWETWPHEVFKDLAA